MPKSKIRQRECAWCKTKYTLGQESNQHKYCSKKCRSDWHYNKWRSNGGHRDPKKLREYQLKHNYGFSIKDFEEKFLRQGSRCAICGTTTTGGSNWHVDHCHATGKNRDILCQGCNQALGLVKEDKKILLSMIDYIDKHNEC